MEIGVIPDYLPKKDGVVRIEHLTGEWIIEEVAANRIQVQYRVHALPGGNIPEWLANSATVDTPYETLQNLKEYINTL